MYPRLQITMIIFGSSIKFLSPFWLTYDKMTLFIKYYIIRNNFNTFMIDCQTCICKFCLQIFEHYKMTWQTRLRLWVLLWGALRIRDAGGYNGIMGTYSFSLKIKFLTPFLSPFFDFFFIFWECLTTPPPPPTTNMDMPNLWIYWSDWTL